MRVVCRLSLIHIYRAYGIEKATELLRSGNSISLLLVDIDNFAEYNRIYGNAKADEVLFAVANCVKIISCLLYTSGCV